MTVDKPKVRNSRIYTRIFIETNGNGPWSCAECTEEVTVIGQGSTEGVIHHKDENYLNNDPSNLEMMHHACHLRHHLVGVPMPTETRKKISETLKGRPSPTTGMTFSDEVNAKKGLPGELNPFYGKTHSTEVREKISAVHKGTKHTDEHKRKISDALKGKPGNLGVKQKCECGLETYPAPMTRHTRAKNHRLATDS